MQPLDASGPMTTTRARARNAARRSRLAGLTRNLDLVRRRSGWLGLAELVADRALPDVLSYRRTFVTWTDCAGAPHPELAARRVRAFEPDLVRIYDELTDSREPEVTRLDEDRLRARFDRGDELWLFQLEGQLAHLRWVRRDVLAFTGFTLPLRPDERALLGTVTVPAMRRHGLSRTALAHVQHVLATEGVTTLFGMVNGSNRRWHAGLRQMGYRPVATAHVISVAGHRLVRVRPASPSTAELLDQRGVRCARWGRASREPRPA